MTYQAHTIARWFIAWAAAEDGDLSNLKLQKLLYYAQGHHLQRAGLSLFDDPIQAWAHGPVVAEVYHKYKSAGSADLTDQSNDDSFSWDEVDEETSQFLIQVWAAYGKYSAWGLRNATHAERPWQEHFNNNGRNIEIPQDDIKAYFEEVAAEAARG